MKLKRDPMKLATFAIRCVARGMIV